MMKKSKAGIEHHIKSLKGKAHASTQEILAEIGDKEFKWMERSGNMGTGGNCNRTNNHPWIRIKGTK